MCRAPLALVLAGLMAGQTVTPSPADASTIRALGFSEIVDRATVVVRGRVVGVRSFVSAPARAADAVEKDSLPPRAGGAAQAAAAAGAPLGLPTEGTGRAIFTQIDLEVAEYIKGTGGSIVQITVVGGTVDGMRMWVPGMPSFQQGEDVLLFLREGYERAGDPTVGVSQGVFRIVTDQATGAETVLDSAGHFVIAIEEDRVVTRRNARAAGASRPVAARTGPPTPEQAGIAASASAQADRFWTSNEPAMGTADFLSAVRARLRR